MQKKSTWKPALGVMHFYKMINTFHKDYLEKPIITSLPINFTLPMVKLTIKSVNTTKRKQSQLAKISVKQTRKF